MTGLLLIPLWQRNIAAHRDQMAPAYLKYRNNAGTGLLEQAGLVPFFYYLGLYPVASLAGPPQSKADAERLVKTAGASLVMEVGPTTSAMIRNGDHVRMFLYYPDIIRTGHVRDPVLFTGNMIAFTLSLIALYVSFWWLRRPVLGLLLVLLIGSHPHQIYEVFIRNNIFGWTITTATFIVALYLPLLDPQGPRGRYTIVLPLLAGVLLGTVRHIRMESALILLSALVTPVFMSRLSRARRASLALAALAMFVATSAVWTRYFRHKIQASNDVVAAAGGYPHPYGSSPTMSHDVFFPIWTGLGDFGADKGYEWSDIAAHRFVKEELKRRYNEDFPPWDGGYVLEGEFIDAKKRYPRLPYSAPHYFDIIGDKVKTDITKNPAWYLGILGRRVSAILNWTAPIKLTAGKTSFLRFQLPWWLPPLMLVFAVAVRQWFFAGLILFTLPLSLPPLLIYAKQGMTLASLFPIFAFTYLLYVLIAGSLWWARFLRRKRSV